MKRTVATVCALCCISVLADTVRVPELNRLKQQLEPVFLSVGLTNQPAIAANAGGAELQGSYHEGRPDGFSIRAVFLAGRPDKRDGVLSRCEETSTGWLFTSSIPVKPNASIQVVFRYADKAASNTVERIKRVIERNCTTKAAEPDPRVVTEATSLFEAQQYSNCVAFCHSNAAVLGAQGLFVTAECYVLLNDVPAAVKELQKVEDSYESDAARAVLRIATLYQQANRTKLCVTALRRLLRTYPESKEAREASERLLQMSQAQGQVEVR